MGSGYFSEVYKGLLKDDTQTNNKKEIAVKVEPSSSERIKIFKAYNNFY